MSSDKKFPRVAYDPLENQKINMMKNKMDKMREMEDLARYLIDDFADKKETSTTAESIDQEINRLTERLNNYQQKIEKLTIAKDFVKDLPFTEGDAAFHPEHGNVIVDMFTLNIENLEASTYRIVTRSQRIKVPYKEVIPITEATKTLFGKKK